MQWTNFLLGQAPQFALPPWGKRSTVDYPRTGGGYMNLPQPLFALGFGAYQIGRVAGAKYVSAGRAMPTQQEVELLLNGVLDLGITLIDTAPAYGLSEERIGNCLHGRRDEYNLVTKVGELTIDGKCVFDFSSKGMRASVEHSLRMLQTDFVDCLLIHAPPDDLEVLHETDAVENDAHAA